MPSSPAAPGCLPLPPPCLVDCLPACLVLEPFNSAGSTRSQSRCRCLSCSLLLLPPLSCSLNFFIISFIFFFCCCCCCFCFACFLCFSLFIIGFSLAIANCIEPNAAAATWPRKKETVKQRVAEYGRVVKEMGERTEGELQREKERERLTLLQRQLGCGAARLVVHPIYQCPRAVRDATTVPRPSPSPRPRPRPKAAVREP